jgi:hypothetical protein
MRQVSKTRACGNDKGGCEGNIFLDPESASTVDGFYIGSIIEISPDSPSQAAGQVPPLARPIYTLLLPRPCPRVLVLGAFA